MTKQDYYKRAKSLLKSIVAQRKWLLAHLKGHIDSQWAITEIRNIENAVTQIKSADQYRAYILRKETALRFLIPSTNPKRQEELRELIQEQLN
jgi:hypothetical protein